jgi:hypothetical protein
VTGGRLPLLRKGRGSGRAVVVHPPGYQLSAFGPAGDARHFDGDLSPRNVAKIEEELHLRTLKGPGVPALSLS